MEPKLIDPLVKKKLEEDHEAAVIIVADGYRIQCELIGDTRKAVSAVGHLARHFIECLVGRI